LRKTRPPRRGTPHACLPAVPRGAVALDNLRCEMGDEGDDEWRIVRRRHPRLLFREEPDADWEEGSYSPQQRRDRTVGFLTAEVSVLAALGSSAPDQVLWVPRCQPVHRRVDRVVRPRPLARPRSATRNTPFAPMQCPRPFTTSTIFRAGVNASLRLCRSLRVSKRVVKQVLFGVLFLNRNK
jgi:hypothetical protein